MGQIRPALQAHLSKSIQITQDTKYENDISTPGIRNSTSSKEESAAYFQKAIRQHWSIENQCHLVLDACFREDHNQTRKANAAKNLGTVRRIVLNILKEDPGIKGSLPAKRRRALMNRIYRERLLSLA